MSPPSPATPRENATPAASAATKRARFADDDDHRAGGAAALRLAGPDGRTKRYHDGIVRRRTDIEDVVLQRADAAHEIAGALPREVDVVPKVDLFVPEMLRGALFVGHLVTDLDSVGGALGAAALYGGRAVRASPVNSETAFALARWGLEAPPAIEDVLAAEPDARICLVDHQQTSQMHPAIDPDNVVGVIDHHALQSKTIVTDRPIYIDIRPWGSMSTIVGHTFLTHQRRPSRSVAGMLLCAILSDTLNLQGPTTTEYDKMMVSVLAEIAGVDDIQFLATQQFKAKSKELAALSAHGLVNGDQKTFSFHAAGFEGDVGFAVVETTDDAVILDRRDDLLTELVAGKKERGLAALFLAVVNIVDLRGTLLLCGPAERSLARAAFPDGVAGTGADGAETTLDLGGRVSRKKDYIPAITRAIKGGWRRPVARGRSVVDLASLGRLEVDPLDPHNKAVRRGSALTPSKADGALGDQPLRVVG